MKSSLGKGLRNLLGSGNWPGEGARRGRLSQGVERGLPGAGMRVLLQPNLGDGVTSRPMQNRRGVRPVAQAWLQWVFAAADVVLVCQALLVVVSEQTPGTLQLGVAALGILLGSVFGCLAINSSKWVPDDSAWGRWSGDSSDAAAARTHYASTGDSIGNSQPCLNSKVEGEDPEAGNSKPLSGFRVP